MSTRVTSRRALAAASAVGVAGFVVGGLLLAAGSSAAAPVQVDKSLTFSCPFPLIGTQTLAVRIQATIDVPETEGGEIVTTDFSATATVPPTATQGLALVGAKTIEGSAVANITLNNAGTALPIALPGLTIPETDVPAEGAFDTVASGPVPTAFPKAGPTSIVVGDFATTLTPRRADGSETGLGTFTSDCTLDPGQDTTLLSFTVGEPTEPTETTDPTTEPTTTDPTTTDPTTTEPSTTDPTSSDPTTTTEPTTTEPTTTEPTTTEPTTTEPTTTEPTTTEPTTTEPTTTEPTTTEPTTTEPTTTEPTTTEPTTTEPTSTTKPTTTKPTTTTEPTTTAPTGTTTSQTTTSETGPTETTTGETTTTGPTDPTSVPWPPSPEPSETGYVPPADYPSPPPAAGLPDTGASVLLPLGIGAALVAAGVLTLLIQRRRAARR